MHLKDYRAKALTIKELPEGDRPREKLLSAGVEQLSDSELLAILLRTGSQTASALDVARRLVRQCGGLRRLSRQNHHEISTSHGIGIAKAATLIAAFELGRRIQAAPAESTTRVTTPEVVFKRFAPRLSHLSREIFMILTLNSANVLMRDVRISEGILNSSLVHPREVFKPAILESAASIILIHNHPSGDVKPSPEDRRVTRRLCEAGRLLDIPVLDHIILAEHAYFSFREAGILEEDPS